MPTIRRQHGELGRLEIPMSYGKYEICTSYAYVLISPYRSWCSRPSLLSSMAPASYSAIRCRLPSKRWRSKSPCKHTHRNIISGGHHAPPQVERFSDDTNLHLWKWMLSDVSMIRCAIFNIRTGSIEIVCIRFIVGCQRRNTSELIPFKYTIFFFSFQINRRFASMCRCTQFKNRINFSVHENWNDSLSIIRCDYALSLIFFSFRLILCLRECTFLSLSPPSLSLSLSHTQFFFHCAVPKRFNNS